MTEITKEQLAVIEAAKAWNKRYRDGDIGADAYTTTRRLLSEAVDALPKPYVPLVSNDELSQMWNGHTAGPITSMREAGTMALRAAADRLEEKQLSGDWLSLIPMLREWADEEEKLNK